MATTFKWSIRELERNSSDDGVHHVRWLASATETVDGVDHMCRLSGKTHHNPNASSSDFIAYASLKETDVLGWVQSIVGKDKVETELQEMLNKKKTPVTKTGLPW
tara:strand:- start:756 stop:1070 length:315 start_codon:yes stop_codon:yes gene_type:complete